MHLRYRHNKSPSLSVVRSPCQRRHRGAEKPMLRRLQYLAERSIEAIWYGIWSIHRTFCLAVQAATEPESRWSRPMTTGALNSPFLTISLNAWPKRSRSFKPTQQIRAGRLGTECVHVPYLASCVDAGYLESVLYFLVCFVDVFQGRQIEQPTEWTDAFTE